MFHCLSTRGKARGKTEDPGTRGTHAVFLEALARGRGGGGLRKELTECRHSWTGQARQGRGVVGGRREQGANGQRKRRRLKAEGGPAWSELAHERGCGGSCTLQGSTGPRPRWQARQGGTAGSAAAPGRCAPSGAGPRAGRPRQRGQRVCGVVCGLQCSVFAYAPLHGHVRGLTMRKCAPGRV